MNNSAAPWWKRYPEKSWGYGRDAWSDEIPDPRLTVGTRVRLRGKPSKIRKVERVEWHRYRARYVYEVEVSGCAYWFSDQLSLADDDLNRPIIETQPVWWQRLRAALKW